MFSKAISAGHKLLHVRLVASDETFTDRAKAVLTEQAGYHLEVRTGRLSEIVSTDNGEQHTSLLIVELANDENDLSALGDLVRTYSCPPAIIVVAEGLNEAAARRLLKLQVTDWLPKSCTSEELANACVSALRKDGAASQSATRCLSFLSAVGGAGATTLASAALDVVMAKPTSSAPTACIVDLNFQSGVLTDYLDLEPALDVSEIISAPERLDWHMLEVMLSRHRAGFSLLAAQPSLNAHNRLQPDLLGRMLDTISARFDNLIIDMPPLWMPWSESIMLGADRLYVVTNMTVAGIRHARNMAELISANCARETTASVIVNKATWRGTAGVSKRHAKDLLGPYLAGFVPDAGLAPTEAQNRGLLLSDSKGCKGIQTALHKIIDAAA